MARFDPVEIIDKSGRILGVFDCGTLGLPPQQRDWVVNIPIRKPVPTNLDLTITSADAPMPVASFKWHPVTFYKNGHDGPYELGTHWYLMALSTMSKEDWHGKGFIAVEFKN